MLENCKHEANANYVVFSKDFSEGPIFFGTMYQVDVFEEQFSDVSWVVFTRETNCVFSMGLPEICGTDCTNCFPPENE